MPIWTMVVSVLHELGKLLSRIPRGSLLGDSLLVRARTTSFAVLGASASVGLAVLAIALHEDWPLVPGSPPPRPVARHAALGEATAVGGGRSRAGVASGAAAPGGNATGAQRGAQSQPPAGAHPHPAPSTGSVTAPTGELVVSPSVQAPESGHTGGSGGAHSPRIPPRPPKPKPVPPAKTPPAPPPAVAPPPAPSPAPPAPTPEATASASPPEESNVPSWSNGQGHAYGREDGGHGHGDSGGSGDGHDD
jgi:hypothetical protein